MEYNYTGSGILKTKIISIIRVLIKYVIEIFNSVEIVLGILYTSVYGYYFSRLRSKEWQSAI